MQSIKNKNKSKKPKNKSSNASKASILSWKKFLNIASGAKLKISLLTIITVIASIFPYNMIQNERAKRLIAGTFKAIGVQSSVVSEGLNYEQSQALEKSISSSARKIKDEQARAILEDYSKLNQDIFKAGGISAISDKQRQEARQLLDELSSLEKKGIKLDSSQQFLRTVIGDSDNPNIG